MESYPKLLFTSEFSENEAIDRGYLSHVCADFGNGRLYPIEFYSIGRLADDLEYEKVIADPGMIVVPKIELSVIENALQMLSQADFFDYLTPLTSEEIKAVMESPSSRWPPLRKLAVRTEPA